MFAKGAGSAFCFGTGVLSTSVVDVSFKTVSSGSIGCELTLCAGTPGVIAASVNRKGYLKRLFTMIFYDFSIIKVMTQILYTSNLETTAWKEGEYPSL